MLSASLHLAVTVFAANKALEKKVSEGEELKNRLEAELREKLKKMEKELENATTKAAGKRCCRKPDTHTLDKKVDKSTTFTHACAVL